MKGTSAPLRRAILTGAAAMAAVLAIVGPASAAGEEHNCYGAAVKAFLAGPGGNPGTTNGQVTSGFAQEQLVDDFQQAFREAAANCGETP